MIWVVEEIKNVFLSFSEMMNWLPEKHDIKNSKCVNFNIKLCCYCKAGEYNTCLINCERHNIAIEKDNFDAPAYIKLKLTENYIKLYVAQTVEHYFHEYQYIIDAYETVYGKIK